MTESKPIIIDGVDVAGCDFLAKEDDYCSYSGEYRAYKGECGCSDGEMCKDYPNCFYKKALRQLARKTQECEELEKKLNYIRDENIHLKESATDEQIDFLAFNNYIKTLEFQIDQLKAENEELKLIREKLYKFNKELIEEKFKIHTEEIKAEQKLERIRDIVEELYNSEEGCEATSAAYAILQIIDEVK